MWPTATEVSGMDLVYSVGACFFVWDIKQMSEQMVYTGRIGRMRLAIEVSNLN